MMMARFLLGPKRAYLRCNGRGFNSVVEIGRKLGSFLK